MTRPVRPSSPPVHLSKTVCTAVRRLLLWGWPLLLSAGYARAAAWDDLERALAQLDRPTAGRKAAVESLELPLATGTLFWERGHCRVLRLGIGADSLTVVELSGKGRLALAFPDSLERIAVRAALGRHAEDKKLKRVTLVLDAWPADWPHNLSWKPIRSRIPLFPVPSIFGHERLARLDPGNPLLRNGASTRTHEQDSFLWLLSDPDEWTWTQDQGLARLSRPLHDGSSVDVPVSGLQFQRSSQDSAPLSPDEVLRLPPRAGSCPAEGQLHLSVAPQGSSIRWALELTSACITESRLFLQLDPRATLDSATWAEGNRDRPARTSRGLKGATASPWLMLEAPGTQASSQLRLTGHSPRTLAVMDSPGRRRAGRSSWFPCLPWWAESQPFQLSDPDSLLPAWLELGLQGRADAGTALRLRPEERTPLRLSESVLLCWTPLREQADFHVPQASRVRPFTPDIANLDLPRERDVRSPDRDEPVEPADLSQGADTLSLGILQEEQVLGELSQAASRLEAWLGRPPHLVVLSERRGSAADRQEEMDLLLTQAAPLDEPLEIEARLLCSATPGARLARLERLCRGWWLPEHPADEASPRWIRWGAARACALLLMEERQGSPWARSLREKALEQQLSLFRPNAQASLPALGERAEGNWHSADTQELLAWRFALLLEHLRWRVRDPQSLDDGAYRNMLRELMLRLRDPLTPRDPLGEVRRALSDFLVANDLLERSGFGDAPTLWAWLDAQWTQSRLPELRIQPGRVETPDGPRLALKASWSAPPVPGTVLPVLAHTAAGYTAWNLRAVAREEQYLLPLDPAELLGLEVAPGGSLAARVRLD